MKKVDWEKEFYCDTWDSITREELVRKHGVYEDTHNPRGIEDFIGHPWCGYPFRFGPKKLKPRKILNLYWDYNIIVVFNNKDKNYYLVAQYPNVVIDRYRKKYWVANHTTSARQRIKMRLGRGERNPVFNKR